MKYLRIKTPFCGVGSLRIVTIGAGFFYLIIAIAGVTVGFSFKSAPLVINGTLYEYGYGFDGENYMLYLFGISCILWIIANLFLLYGAILKQYRFLLPWIYWHVVLPIVAVAEMIWAAVLLEKLSHFEVDMTSPLEQVGVAILYCVVTCLCTVIYFWIVVYSFYSELKEAEDKLAIASSRSPTAPTTEYNGPMVLPPCNGPTEVAHVHAEAPPISRPVILNVQPEVLSSQRSQLHNVSDLPSNRRPSHYNSQPDASSNPHLQQLHTAAVQNLRVDRNQPVIAANAWNMRRRDQPIEMENRTSSHHYYAVPDEITTYENIR
ncbi:uncharacterized protein [Periplaneta americana]|uniref:uncharacterized protein isoform X2 n=1 Tax=Periplaneta americana TaxID=6978 RepID=UPI0037E7960F